LQAIPSKFLCATFKKTFKILLILWHCFQLMGTYWSDLLSSIFLYSKNKKEKKRKVTPPWYVNVGGHPMKSVSHDLWKEKGGEECQAL
jgi:hypothetical protein